MAKLLKDSRQSPMCRKRLELVLSTTALTAGHTQANAVGTQDFYET